MTYYITSTNKQQLMEQLLSAGIYTRGVGDELIAPAGVDLDLVGYIYVKTDVDIKSINGDDITDSKDMKPIVGDDGEMLYHANIRGITSKQASMLNTIPAPNTPIQVWWS